MWGDTPIGLRRLIALVRQLPVTSNLVLRSTDWAKVAEETATQRGSSFSPAPTAERVVTSLSGFSLRRHIQMEVLGS